MKRFYRVISFLVLTAFIFNIFLLDSGFGQPINNSSTLATAARTDDILGSQIPGVTAISMIFMGFITALEQAGCQVTPEVLRDPPKTISTKEIDNIPGAHIYRREAKLGADGVITIKATKGGTTYEIEYAAARDSHSLRVYPKGQKPPKPAAVLTTPALPDAAVRDLKIMTRILERDVVDMIFKAGSGHPGGSLSMLKAVCALYFGTDANGGRIMRYDPNDPQWKNRDRFVLSKGHAAPGLYAALGRAEYFAKRIAELKKQGKLKTEDVEELFATLRKLGSDLQGHTDMTKTPGVEFSGGPLGVGFSAAVGMATAARMDDRDYITYCMLGDGETQEGQVDEAGRHAAAILKDKAYKEAATSGLKMIAFLDWNGQQIDNPVTDVDVDYEGQVKLWEARGWNVVRVDSEDIGDVARAIQDAKSSLNNGKPAIVIMKTSKGAGLPGMAKHGAVPKEAELKQAFDIIDKDLTALSNGAYKPENPKEFIRVFTESLIRKTSINGDVKAGIDAANQERVDARREQLHQLIKGENAQKIIAELRKAYPADKKVATRTASGHEFTLIGADDIDVVAMAADLVDSVKFDEFAKAFGSFNAKNLSGRYIAPGIREAHMVAFAAGLATCGKIPFIGTFSIFTTRMLDQLNDILNTKLPIIIVGTHGGLATGPDGRTHQDAHSLGVLGALPGVQTYEGSDAEEERVLLRHVYETAKKKGGIHYIRPARLDTPIITDKPKDWQEGAKRGFYTIFDTGVIGRSRHQDRRDVVIVSSGVVTADAIQAAKELSSKYGFSVKVVNVTQLKAITSDEANRRDFEKLIKGGKNIISVIDALPGILGDRIDNILARQNIKPKFVRNLGINRYGESGTPAELYKLHGFDKDGIVKTARILAGKGISLLRVKGQSVWADGAFMPEELAFLKKKGVTGQTTNLTIINNAIKAGAFDKEIQDGIARGLSPEQIYDAVCISYIKSMAEEWLPIYKSTNHLDGYVSIEVNPEYAYDVKKTVDEAVRLVKAIGMPNVMVKIPATKEGIKAFEELTYLGINGNVTLLFGVSNYEEIKNAHDRGLQRREAEGLENNEIRSVASFFVSRVNCKPDAADEQIKKAIEREKARTDDGREAAINVRILEGLIGKAAIANTVLAYARLRKHLGSTGWKHLESYGSNVQRLLWASTEIKSNEAYADGTKFSPLMYVRNLPLPNTVNTMPRDTIYATIMADTVQAEPRNSMSEQEAQKVMDTLEGFGIKIDDITAKLQMDGVESFSKDYATSLEFIKKHVERVQKEKTAEALPAATVDAKPMVVHGPQKAPDQAGLTGTTSSDAAKAAVTVPVAKTGAIENKASFPVRQVDIFKKIIRTAGKAGAMIPVDADVRYSLLVTSEFFADTGELKDHQIDYGERFNLDSISGRDADEFIVNVLSNPLAVRDRTIVLLPNELANGKFENKHYQALKDAGIRFIVANRNELLEARAAKDVYRKQFQMDTYATMLLVRAIDDKTDVNSPIYRLLSFYLKTHFNFVGTIAIDDYIMAIAKNEIGKLIRGILAYRPAQAYDKPDYGKVAAALISA